MTITQSKLERCAAARKMKDALHCPDSVLVERTGFAQQSINLMLNRARGSERLLTTIEVALGQYAAERVCTLFATLGDSESTHSHIHGAFAATAGRVYASWLASREGKACR